MKTERECNGNRKKIQGLEDKGERQSRWWSIDQEETVAMVRFLQKKKFE